MPSENTSFSSARANQIKPIVTPASLVISMKLYKAASNTLPAKMYKKYKT